jgi:hypothetical protein
MAKNGGNVKGNNKKEKELFEAPVVNEGGVQEVPVNEEVKATEEIKAAEEIQNEEMGMELELDGEEVQGQMEELVKEKVNQEEKENQEQKSKRGPKPGNKKDDVTPVADDKPADKPKEKALNLKDKNIVEREIKKGRLSAPQGRIEKTEAGDYIMLLADGIIFPQDAKGNYKEISHIAKMNDGKYVLTNHAATTLNTDKFTAKHENGEETIHDYVRVELHKPGRDKDVVELYTVTEARNFLKIQDAKTTKKEEEAKKKAEKEAKEKAEKEAAEKKETEKEVPQSSK